MTRRLAIVGYGKMGRMIERLAPEFGFEVCARISGMENAAGHALTAAALKGVDVAVEFTRPDAAAGNLLKLANAGVSTVCGTTGWFATLPQVSAEFEKNGNALVW